MTMKSLPILRPIVILLLITATLLYPVVVSAELGNKG
jgi:hypothetical protein